MYILASLIFPHMDRGWRNVLAGLHLGRSFSSFSPSLVSIWHWRLVASISIIPTLIANLGFLFLPFGVAFHESRIGANDCACFLQLS